MCLCEWSSTSSDASGSSEWSTLTPGHAFWAIHECRNSAPTCILEVPIFILGHFFFFLSDQATDHTSKYILNQKRLPWILWETVVDSDT